MSINCERERVDHERERVIMNINGNVALGFCTADTSKYKQSEQ